MDGGGVRGREHVHSAPVDVEDRAVDRGGLVRGEIDRRRGDRLRVTGASAGAPRMNTAPGYSVAGFQSGGMMTPGEIALTRMPRGPNSAAQDLVSVSTAPLVEL